MAKVLKMVASRFDDCSHINKCRVCKESSRWIHAHAGRLKDWSSIRILLRTARNVPDEDERNGLPSAAGGLACAIARLAEDIENETLGAPRTHQGA